MPCPLAAVDNPRLCRQGGHAGLAHLPGWPTPLVSWRRLSRWGDLKVNAHASVHVLLCMCSARLLRQAAANAACRRALLLSLPAPLCQVACKRDAVLVLLCRQVQVDLKGIQGASKEGFIALLLKLVSKPPALVSYELMVMNQDQELSTADGKWWQPCTFAHCLPATAQLALALPPCLCGFPLKMPISSSTAFSSAAGNDSATFRQHRIGFPNVIRRADALAPGSGFIKDGALRVRAKVELRERAPVMAPLHP